MVEKIFSDSLQREIRVSFDDLSISYFVSVPITNPIENFNRRFNEIDQDSLVTKLKKEHGLDLISTYYNQFGPTWNFYDVNIGNYPEHELHKVLELSTNEHIDAVALNMFPDLFGYSGEQKQEIESYSLPILTTFVQFLEEKENYKIN